MGAPHSSLKDNVYAYIAGRIDSGELSAGDRVSEQAICDAMGVSRTPVREALIQLASDGYLDNLPRRGFRVRGSVRSREKGEYVASLFAADFPGMFEYVVLRDVEQVRRVVSSAPESH